MVARETKTHTQLFFQKIDPMQFNGLLPARVELKKKPLAHAGPKIENEYEKFLWKIYINDKNFAFLKFKKCFDHLPHHKARLF